MEYICSRCNQTKSENRCGTADEPYCQPCWLIHYFNIPQSVVDKIDAEIESHRQAGVVEDTLQKLRFSALNKQANLKRTEFLSRSKGLIAKFRGGEK